MRSVLQWVQNTLRDAGHEPPKNWKEFADGRAFCTLLHVVAPDSFPEFLTLEFTKENAEQNLEACFLAAEKLGIPKLLDGEDIAVCPDDKSISTYLLKWHQQFAGGADSPQISVSGGLSGSGSSRVGGSPLGAQKVPVAQSQQPQQNDLFVLPSAQLRVNKIAEEVAAREQATVSVASSQKEADMLIDEAKRKAEQIIADSVLEAKKSAQLADILLHEARTEAAKIKAEVGSLRQTAQDAAQEEASLRKRFATTSEESPVKKPVENAVAFAAPAKQNYLAFVLLFVLGIIVGKFSCMINFG